MRYSTALGSAGETRACVEVAGAMGYVEDVDPELRDLVDRVIRTLSKLAAHRG